MPVAITPPPLPHWATHKGMAIEMRKRQVLRFLFNYAALMHGPKTTLRSLAADCGYSETAITTAISLCSVSEDLAGAITSMVGRNNFDAMWLVDPAALLK